MDSLGLGSLDIEVKIPVRVGSTGCLIGEDESFQSNALTDYYWLVFVRSGKAIVVANGTELEIEAGHAIVISPGNKIRCKDGKRGDLKAYWCQFLLDDMAGSDKCDRVSIPTISKVSRPDKLTELFRLLNDAMRPNHREKYSTRCLLMQILCEAGESESPADSMPRADLRVVERARNYIRLNIESDISTSVVAKALDCSPSYLSRVFREVNGVTVTHFIQGARIYRARRMLVDTDDSVEQVAHKCGFDDPGYFRRVFVKTMGMSPREYRKLYSRQFLVKYL